jgi:hypothetical protein
MPNNISLLPEWEQVLSAAAHLQRILPDAILVGGTASAIHAGHRMSTDANHVLDFCAMATRLGEAQMVEALRSFDEIYPQPNEESALQQLQIQLAEPLPFDLDRVNLTEYKHLASEWQEWEHVRAACAAYAMLVFERIIPYA